MSRGFAAKNLPHLRNLRAAIRFLDPDKYRGISRDPLQPYPSLDPEVIQTFADTGMEMRNDEKARWRFRELVGDPDQLADDDDILADLRFARELLELVDRPSDYEIIRVRKVDFERSPETLGFDIGYWGGDHFSLIADSCVTPTWHPPQPEAFVELSERLRHLNQNLLFETTVEAESFKRWYKTQPWAEIESDAGEFSIIQVDEVRT